MLKPILYQLIQVFRQLVRIDSWILTCNVKMIPFWKQSFSGSILNVQLCWGTSQYILISECFSIHSQQLICLNIPWKMRNKKTRTTLELLVYRQLWQHPKLTALTAHPNGGVLLHETITESRRRCRSCGHKDYPPRPSPTKRCSEVHVVLVLVLANLVFHITEKLKKTTIIELVIHNYNGA